MAHSNLDKKTFIDRDELLLACSGKWDLIFSSLAPGFHKALQRKGKHVACPVHGGKDGFRFYRNFDQTGGGVCNTCNGGVGFKDGIAVLCWYFDGTPFNDVLAAIADCIGYSSSDNLSSLVHNARPAKTQDQILQEEKKRKNRNDFVRNLLNTTWRNTLDLLDPKAEPARLYLARRGLKTSNLHKICNARFHPNLPYYSESDKKNLGNFPAIVLQVQNCKGLPVTLHRIYIDSDGFKLNLGPDHIAKKMMPIPDDVDYSGAAIRLLPVQFDHNGLALDCLGIGEGFETCLAIIDSVDFPIWCTLSTSFTSTFQPPNGVTQVVAYGDFDENDAGKNACENFIERSTSEGIESDYYIPDVVVDSNSQSTDWLDIYVKYGSTAIPGNPNYQPIDVSSAI